MRAEQSLQWVLCNTAWVGKDPDCESILSSLEFCLIKSFFSLLFLPPLLFPLPTPPLPFVCMSICLCFCPFYCSETSPASNKPCLDILLKPRRTGATVIISPAVGAFLCCLSYQTLILDPRKGPGKETL